MTRYKKSQTGYMFLYQLLISCWLYEKKLTVTDIKRILTHAIEKYQNKEIIFRKDVNINDYSLFIFMQHIRKHIPELKMLDGSIYGEKYHGTEITNNSMFKTILFLERELPTLNNPIFLVKYPTDSLLEEILRELNLKK